MNKDTCVHFIEATGCCRARKPNCAYHYDGVCRAAGGKLQERPAVQSYDIRPSRWSPARALRDGLSGGDVEPIEARHIHQLLDWIIVGAETGNRRDRAVPELAWLRKIYDHCHQVEIPLFFKGSLRHLWPADADFPQQYPVGSISTEAQA